MRYFIISLATLLSCVTTVSRGDEALPAKVLSELKDSTVFVKVDAGRVMKSGSGFLIKADGETAYVVTNFHVVDTSSPAGAGRVDAPAKAIISVVFGSGTRKEQVCRAEAVAVDPDRDLAVLKVDGVKNLPSALDLTQPATPSETMPVYVFGFPFGEQLSSNHHNPAITVGRGAVSSIRLGDDGKIKAIQIDGALNPGNSGGPVVDGEGRLAGIAVATIRGSNIGLAIPPAELSQMLFGRVGGYHLATTKGDKGTCTVHVTMRLIDPLNKIKSVTFHYLPGEIPKDAKATLGLGSLPGGNTVELKVDGPQATGSFDLPVPDAGTTIYFQTNWVNGDGKSLYTRPRPYHVSGTSQTSEPR